MDYDKFCKKCKHHEFNLQTGILCALTNQAPSYATDCKEFILDPERERKAEIKKSAKEASDLIICPKCQSTQVNAASVKAQKVVRWLIYFIGGGSIATVVWDATENLMLGIIVMGILGIIIKSFPISTRAKCQSCGNEWKAFV